MSNQSMCMFPWDSVAIFPNGQYRPCCLYNFQDDLTQNSNIGPDFRNNTLWKNLRQNILDGRPVDACKSCYQQEAAGSKSLRQRSLTQTSPINSDVLPLRNIEVSFSNLCNLACVHCGPALSSTWGAQDYKFGRQRQNKILVEHNFDFEQIDLSHVNELKIIGGEPFMEQKRFIDLIKKMDLSKLILRVSTNGTVLPNSELKDLIDQCHQVYLGVSVDGVDKVNEWFRWPSQFSHVQSVMHTFEQWWGKSPNHHLYVHHTIGMYNIWSLDKTMMFMNQNFPSWYLYFGFVRTPTWQNISIMPESMKSSLKEKLLNWRANIKANWDQHNADPFSLSLSYLNHKAEDTWENFIANTKRLSQERNLDVFATIPELQNMELS